MARDVSKQIGPEFSEPKPKVEMEIMPPANLAVFENGSLKFDPDAVIEKAEKVLKDIKKENG